jgi:MFS family permease
MWSRGVAGGNIAGMTTTLTAAERRELRLVIFASSAGTMVEWYDFFVFGALATIIADTFYPSGNETVNFLKTLATFGAGFAVRPLGGLLFGRIGDRAGRKVAFTATLLLMGGATATIGLLPSYDSAGVVAPLLLVTLRLLQGLALGGEYGGAAIYVAEHAPDAKRGFYTSFIQTTASLGLLLSLVVILIIRGALGEETFNDWGWRLPFLLSAVLVGVSLWIRRRLRESPVFAKLQAEGKTSTSPVRDAYGSRQAWKAFFTVLLGVTAGQAVIWYTAQFYALYFLQTIAEVPLTTASGILATSLVIGTPAFVFFGWLSDRIGRRPVMLFGMAASAFAFRPIYRAMLDAAQPEPDVVRLVLLVVALLVFAAATYGPIAAYLVESFPARVRYTSVSLPYHLGNGWFGGFLPLIATWAVARTGDPLAGLWYPIAVALLTAVIGVVVVKETAGTPLHPEDEDDVEAAPA